MYGFEGQLDFLFNDIHVWLFIWRKVFFLEMTGDRVAILSYLVVMYGIRKEAMCEKGVFRTGGMSIQY